MLEMAGVAIVAQSFDEQFQITVSSVDEMIAPFADA